MPIVLHVLSQRPSLTGSGVTLDALVRHGTAADWDQHVVVGVPADDPLPDVGGLDPERIHPLRFGVGELDFPVPGMSDVMPYPSTRFSAMTDAQIDAYRHSWRRHLEPLIDRLRPDLIHSHHLWLVSSMLEDLAPSIPVVTQCHATGFRQLELCPHLADGVRRGCRRIDRFAVLHRGHADQLERTLELPPGRIHIVGAGYRDDLFHPRGRAADSRPRLLYVGKYSRAKGLPWLLDAFEQLLASRPTLELHVAGSGAGREAEGLRDRMSGMAPTVTLHGQLAQPALAELMRRTTVCVLPSFFEGLPLVLVESLACGNRLVATALPGVVEQLASRLGQALALVDLPRLREVDVPEEADLPEFVARLRAAIESAIEEPPIGDPAATVPGGLDHFGWGAVFRRVEAIWKELLAGTSR